MSEALINGMAIGATAIGTLVFLGWITKDYVDSQRRNVERDLKKYVRENFERKDTNY